MYWPLTRNLRKLFGQESPFSILCLKRLLFLPFFFFFSVLGIEDGLDNSSPRGYNSFEINKGGLGIDEKEWVEFELPVGLGFQFCKDV